MIADWKLEISISFLRFLDKCKVGYYTGLFVGNWKLNSKSIFT